MRVGGRGGESARSSALNAAFEYLTITDGWVTEKILLTGRTRHEIVRDIDRFMGIPSAKAMRIARGEA